MEELSAKVNDLEKKILELKLHELEKKLNTIVNSSKETDPERKKEICEQFFDKFLEISKGKRIVTASLMRKANEYAEKYNVRFTKFEFSDFMCSKGIERRKIGGINYYCDLAFKQN